MKYSVFKKSCTPNVKLELVQSMDYLHELNSSDFVDKVEVVDMVSGKSIHSDNIVFVEIVGHAGTGKTLAAIWIKQMLNDYEAYINDVDYIGGDAPRVLCHVTLNELIKKFNSKLSCYVNGKLTQLVDLSELKNKSTNTVFVIKTHQLQQGVA